MSPDIRLIVKVKNARVLRAMEEVGITSVAELCRRMGKSPTDQSQVGLIINFKMSPLSVKGEWRPVAIAIATALHQEPDELWPQYLRAIEAKKTEVQIDMTVEEFAQLSDNCSAEQLAMQRDLIEKVMPTNVSERSKNILEMRFGLNGNGIHTYDEIAGIFQITSSRVQQIEQKTLQRMRLRLGKVASGRMRDDEA